MNRLLLPVSGLYSSPLVHKADRGEKDSTVRRVCPPEDSQPFGTDISAESGWHQLRLPALSGISSHD